MFSVCLHELFHALAAYWEGDSTAKSLGYFTLNPMMHMGPASLIIPLLTGMCWGQCPVDSSRFRHQYGDALASFAGPFANLLLLILSASLVAFMIFIPVPLMPEVVQANLLKFLQLMSYVNASLFLFNLIPIPPLDGHAILAAFFPKARVFYSQMDESGLIVLFLLLSLPMGSELLWGRAEALSGKCLVMCGQMLSLTGIG